MRASAASAGAAWVPPGSGCRGRRGRCRPGERPRRPGHRESRDEERPVARRAGGRAHAGLLAPRAPGPQEVNEPVRPEVTRRPVPARVRTPGARTPETCTRESARPGERMSSGALRSWTRRRFARRFLPTRAGIGHVAGVGVAGPDRRCSTAWPSPRPSVPGCCVPRPPVLPTGPLGPCPRRRCRPRHVPAPRPASPPLARPGDHLRRRDPARPRDARTRRDPRPCTSTGSAVRP